MYPKLHIFLTIHYTNRKNIVKNDSIPQKKTRHVLFLLVQCRLNKSFFFTELDFKFPLRSR
jgi:hypothetical protein